MSLPFFLPHRQTCPRGKERKAANELIEILTDVSRNKEGRQRRPFLNRSIRTAYSAPTPSDCRLAISDPGPIAAARPHQTAKDYRNESR